LQINFYVFVFQRVANFGAKKENTPLQIYIDDALLYGFGCAFVWVALLYGLRFCMGCASKNANELTAASVLKPQFMPL
jgi:hypothetical protein